MRKKLMLSLLCALMLLLSSAGRTMDEGMWLLDTIGKLPVSDMKSHGLELTPEQIYSANGPSLKDAIVLLGGGTSSFVSPEGLMVTNHHVAYGSIQSLSSVKTDYLKDGFWAKTRDEELRTNLTAQIVTEIKDVTSEVLSAVNDTMSAGQRAAAIRERSREIERTAKGNSDLTCRVSEMYSGVSYYLFTFQALTDVRLVYAPPSAIGNYGGEVDNWIWPRHTGDFSIMRAYVGPDGKPAKYAKENVPFKPKVFLPISAAGYKEGSFAMIMGFPGRTFRYREASSVELARDETLPLTVELYKTRMDIINAASENDRSVAIKYASKVRGIANTYKNYLGTLEGMRRANLLDIKRKDEEQFTAYINASPELTKKYGTLLDDMAKANADLKTFNQKYIFLNNLTAGVDILRLANRFRTYAQGSQSEAQKVALREVISTTFKNFDLNVEKQLLTALILKGADLPASQQVAALTDIYGDRTGTRRQQKVKDFVDDLYDDSDLSTPEGCEKLLEKGGEKIVKDDYLKFAAKIDAEQTPIAAKNTAYNATIGGLRAKYVQARLDYQKGELVYPDANRTIRFTYGQVRPYKPRDAVEYDYSTTLTGVMEKETGKDPFIVPPKLKELWQKKDFGQYADPKTGDIPVAFIADLDITGGNSGSPVINGKGELIGCAFDGNWEAVVGDYYFQPALNRTIAVDTRYMLFILDKYSNAQNILKEMVIRWAPASAMQSGGSQHAGSN
jgi:hypothetical protein